MTCELLPGLPCPQLAHHGYTHHKTSDSVGRTSAFIYAATVTVLFGFIPGVAADCWIDSYVVMTLARSTTLTLFSPTLSSSGYEVCDDGLNNTIRIIIGIAACNPPSPLLINFTPLTNPFSPVISLVSILSLIGYRRRRAAQANIVYLQQVPQARGGMNGSPYGPNGGPPSAPPPYPPPTYKRYSLTSVVVQVRL